MPVLRRPLALAPVPASMRRSRSTPLVDLPADATCCKGIVTASAEELPHRQQLFPGTTAWRISYNRRQVVEGVNGMLKGGFVDIQHKFFRVFGLTKTKLLLAFTVVGYNLEAIRSFLAKKAVKVVTAAKNQGKRKKRRKGTWTRFRIDLIGRRPMRRDRAARLLRPDPHLPLHSFLIKDVTDMAR